MITEREYQIEARKAVLNEWAAGNRRTLVVLPTGCGKTVVCACIMQQWMELHNNQTRILFMAHRGELLDQAANTIKDVTGYDCSLEKAGSTCIGNDAPVVLASVQTLSQDRRLAQFDKNYFSAIIVDEAHHSLSDSYQKVLKHFSSAVVLGVTATPDRGDLKDMGTYYDSCAYEYQIKDAIKQNYLVPVRAKVIPLELDISNVRCTTGDYSTGDVGNTLSSYLKTIANEVVKYCWTRKTVVFTPLISTSIEFCKLLKARGMKAAEINGKSADRAKILAGFRKGKYTILCNSMLLTEGWDCPEVDCIIVLRPTQSRSLYQQMVGRGMRLAPDKKELLLLDFLWLTAQLPLCRPSCLISRDDDIAARIDKKMREAKDGIYIDEAEEEAERDIVSERKTALASSLDKMRKGTGRNGGVNPIQYAISIESEELLSYQPIFEWETTPATEKQLDFISKCGIEAESVLNKGQASKILDVVLDRRRRGLSSPKQIRYLEQRGFIMVGKWSFQAAANMMNLISNNGWNVPSYIDPESYQP